MKIFLLAVSLVFLFSSSALACVKPWSEQVINKINFHNFTYQKQSQFQKQQQGQSQSVENSGNNSGVSSVQIKNTPDFPMPYVPIPAAPLDAPELAPEPIYGDVFPLRRPKWLAEEIDYLPDAGKAIPSIFGKTKSVKYIYTRDGRHEEPGPKGTFWLGDIECTSTGPSSTEGGVWGSCGRSLLAHQCTYAYLRKYEKTQAARSEAVNQSGGLSFAGIFGQIFGFNAGGGASNTDHDSYLYKRVFQKWDCYGVQPMEESKK